MKIIVKIRGENDAFVIYQKIGRPGRGARKMKTKIYITPTLCSE